MGDLFFPHLHGVDSDMQRSWLSCCQFESNDSILVRKECHGDQTRCSNFQEPTAGPGSTEKEKKIPSLMNVLAKIALAVPKVKFLVLSRPSADVGCWMIAQRHVISYGYVYI